MRYLQNKQLIEKLQEQNTIIFVEALESISIDLRWISFYDLFNLWGFFVYGTTKPHKFYEDFEEGFYEFIEKFSDLKIYRRYDYFHLEETEGSAKDIFSEMTSIDDEEDNDDYWARYEWRDLGLAKNYAFSFLFQNLNTKQMSKFDVKIQDILLVEKLDDFSHFIKINLEGAEGEYAEDLHNKIEKIAYENNFINNVEVVIDPSNNDDLIKENSILKEQLKKMEKRLSDVNKVGGDVSDNPMAKKAVSKLIGSLIKRAFPSLTKDKGLAAHGLIEAISREANIDPSVVSRWVDIALFYESK